MTSVLVVEDDESIAELLAVLLRQEGHEVAIATDGVQALLQLDTGTHDLAVLDVMMPDLDGIHVLRQVRQSLEESEVHVHDIPMIVVTGDPGAAATCREMLGASNVFTKPFDAADVVARVQALLPDTDEGQQP